MTYRPLAAARHVTAKPAARTLTASIAIRVGRAGEAGLAHAIATSAATQTHARRAGPLSVLSEHIGRSADPLRGSSML
jgi:hypothetical protein